jgi:hypothetical protein
MRCENANHAEHGGTPAAAHYVEKKEARGEVFGLDLQYVETDGPSTIRLCPGVCQSHYKSFSDWISVNEQSNKSNELCNLFIPLVNITAPM